MLSSHCDSVKWFAFDWILIRFHLLFIVAHQIELNEYDYVAGTSGGHLRIDIPLILEKKDFRSNKLWKSYASQKLAIENEASTASN